MKVAIYHRSVPGLKNKEKIDLLLNFSTGVRVAGDIPVDIQTYCYLPTDVGVIQGWATLGSKENAHSLLRRQVIENQAQRNRYTVAVDSNLFLYKNVSNRLHYLRYSFNGVFPNTGIYCDSEIDPSRWNKIKRNLDLELKPERQNGNHILLCLQRNGGWSMGGLDLQEWVLSTVKQIREVTSRPIIIRTHPGDKGSKLFFRKDNPECKVKFSKALRMSTKENMIDDLKDCWAAVNYNSSSVVGAAIEGIPIFVTNPESSQCAEIANTDVSQIEFPRFYDRQKWAERLSMFHWNFDELKSGECWSHMRKFVRV